ncbi:MAG TPA: hypothetical protein PKY56_02975 [Candidatus Kapabacteria bacterium]|nr:hypothetical protein [Candidatus Kapabacteria bacterium]
MKDVNLSDFKNRINLESFGEEIVKSIPENDFQMLYPEEKYEFYSTNAILAYTKNVREKLQNIEKAETGANNEEIVKGFEETISSLKRVVKLNNDGTSSILFVKLKDNIEKV